MFRAESHSLLLHATAYKVVSPSPVVGPRAFALCLEQQFQAERQQCHAGGMLAVTFWPSQVEQQGPWQRLADLSTNKPKAFTKSSHKHPVKVQL